MEGLENSIRNRGALAGTAIPKQPNHLDIHDSINNIRSVVRQLIELKDMLNGQGKADKPCQEKEQAPEPSFIEVLNHTSDNIRAECNEAEKVLQEIREMLFN